VNNLPGALLVDFRPLGKRRVIFASDCD